MGDTAQGPGRDTFVNSYSQRVDEVKKGIANGIAESRESIARIHQLISSVSDNYPPQDKVPEKPVEVEKLSVITLKGKLEQDLIDLENLRTSVYGLNDQLRYEIENLESFV